MPLLKGFSYFYSRTKESILISFKKNFTYFKTTTLGILIFKDFFPVIQSLLLQTSRYYQSKLNSYLPIECQFNLEENKVVATKDALLSEKMNMILMQSLRSNLGYLSKVVIGFGLVIAGINEILYLHAEADERGEYCVMGIEESPLNVFIMLYFFRLSIYHLIQNTAFASAVATVGTEDSEFFTHQEICDQVMPECIHKHECFCDPSLIKQADVESVFYYVMNTKLFFLAAQGIEVLAAILRVPSWFWTFILSHRSPSAIFLYNIANSLSRVSVFISYVGLAYEIGATGWCLGEYALSAAGVCTEHRYRDFRRKYPSYIALALVLQMLTSLISLVIYGLTGVRNSYSEDAIKSWLFQILISASLARTQAFPDFYLIPDIFIFHKKLTNLTVTAVTNTLSPVFQDVAFQKRCKKLFSHHWIKFIVFIFLPKEAYSLSALIGTPAISIIICMHENNIELAINILQKVNVIPNIVTSAASQLIGWSPTWLLAPVIVTIVQAVEAFGINKTIKLINDCNLIAHTKHPNMTEIVELRVAPNISPDPTFIYFKPPVSQLSQLMIPEREEKHAQKKVHYEKAEGGWELIEHEDDNNPPCRFTKAANRNTLFYSPPIARPRFSNRRWANNHNSP